MKVVVINTEEQIAEYKRGEESAPFICGECGLRAYTTIKAMEAHVDSCSGRPKVYKKKSRKIKPSASESIQN